MGVDTHIYKMVPKEIHTARMVKVLMCQKDGEMRNTCLLQESQRLRRWMGIQQKRGIPFYPQIHIGFHIR